MRFLGGWLFFFLIDLVWPSIAMSDGGRYASLPGVFLICTLGLLMIARNRPLTVGFMNSWVVNVELPV